MRDYPPHPEPVGDDGWCLCGGLVQAEDGRELVECLHDDCDGCQFYTTDAPSEDALNGILIV